MYGISLQVNLQNLLNDTFEDIIMLLCHVSDACGYVPPVQCQHAHTDVYVGDSVNGALL